MKNSLIELYEKIDELNKKTQDLYYDNICSLEKEESDKINKVRDLLRREDITIRQYKELEIELPKLIEDYHKSEIIQNILR